MQDLNLQQSNRPAGGLLDVLLRQKQLVERLVECARRQGALVRDGNADALLDLLTQRQLLLDLVVATQSEVAEVLGSPEHVRYSGSGDSSDRSKAATMLDEIRSALQVVLQQDDIDQDAIRAAREAARGELVAFGQSLQARKAYSSAGTGQPWRTPSEARFSDRKG
jgi:hypothetical protein